MPQSSSRHRIRCVFYAEFDNIAGPRIVYQCPHAFIQSDVFESVSEYIITKPDLCGKIMTVVHPGFASHAPIGEDDDTARPTQRSRDEPPASAGADTRTHDADSALARGSQVTSASRTLHSANSAFGISRDSDSADGVTAPEERMDDLTDAQPRTHTPTHPDAPAHTQDGAAAAAPVRTSAKIIAFPVGLQHEKYQRNTLLFSVGFVLDVDADTRPYEAVLQKLGLALYSMEMESELLFRPHRKEALARALPDILDGLNARGECFVSIDECDTIALKLFPVLPRPPEVRAHDVPVRLRDLDVLMGDGDDSGWDLCMRIVAPHIDGVSYVRAIAEEADIDVELVRRAMQHFLYYGCIAIVDIFQYSNIYATTPRVQLLLRSHTLRDACLRYITTDDGAAEILAGSLSMTDIPGTPMSPGLAMTTRTIPQATSSPSLTGLDGGAGDVQAALSATPFEYVYRMYAAFGAGSRVCDVCAQGDSEGMGLDDRKFVTFGVLHGLLRRVHKYPVAIQPLRAGTASATTKQVIASAFNAAAPGDESDAKVLEGILPMLDGTHSLEEICCTLCMSQADVEAMIAGDERFVFVLK